jgi:hypothetical protein
MASPYVKRNAIQLGFNTLTNMIKQPITLKSVGF